MPDFKGGSAGPVSETGRSTKDDYAVADLFSIPRSPRDRHPGEADAYPHRPGWKRTDTSRDAAAVFGFIALTMRDQCLAALQEDGPATSDEIAVKIGRPYMSVRPRLTELQAMGLVVDSGQRRLNPQRVRTVVWRLATPGDTRADFLRTEGSQP